MMTGKDLPTVAYQLLQHLLKQTELQQMCIRDRDTGKGMTTEERQKVFQAFTRLKSCLLYTSRYKSSRHFRW